MNPLLQKKRMIGIDPMDSLYFLYNWRLRLRNGDDSVFYKEKDSILGQSDGLTPSKSSNEISASDCKSELYYFLIRDIHSSNAGFTESFHSGEMRSFMNSENILSTVDIACSTRNIFS